MKNKKGEIATLLTLGLVVVGTLITLGTSLFVSNKRITTNSKAALASSYCPSNGDSSCWIVKCLNGKPGKLQYTASLCNSSMPKTSCQGDSPYGGGGTMVIGKTASDAKVKTFECASGTNDEIPSGSGGNSSDDDGEPGAETDTPSCKNITCENTLMGGTTSDKLSFDGNGIYYKNFDCAEDLYNEKKSYVGDAQGWCNEKSATGCSEVTCKKATGGDTNALNENIRQKQVGGTIKYYNLDDESCSYPKDPKTICLPEEKPTCDSVSCSVATEKNDVDFGDKEVFELSDKPGTYYKAGDCEDKVSTNLKVECPLPPPPPPPPIVGGETITFGDTKYLNCFKFEKLKRVYKINTPGGYCNTNGGTIGDKDNIPYCCW